MSSSSQDTGVLLISAEGTVLARSGPADIAGQPTPSMGHPDLVSVFRSQDGVDLSALVAEVAKGNTEDTPSVIVRPVSPGGANGRVRLTLHGVAAGLVVGVLSSAEPAVDPETAAETLDLVWEGLTEGMAVASLDDSPDGPTILGANPAFAALFRVPREEVLFRPISRFLAPVSSSALISRIQEQVLGDGKAISDVTVVKRASGESVLLAWELAPMRRPDGRTIGMIAAVRDRTLGSERDPIYRSLDVDPLSGLPNHAHLLSRLERAVELSARARPYGFAVIGIEMRGLRAVERRLGTLMANTVLEALVRRLELRLRPGDLIARTGERRLAILLDHFAPWGTTDEVLSRIREVTGHPYTIAGERITMSALGVAGPVWSGDHPPQDAQAVLDALDRAVSPADGKSVGIHHIGPPPGPEGSASRPFEFASIADSGQLRLAYLPLVSLDTGRLVGLEALVQWAHPDRGVLSGHQFLGDAEQAGQIHAIDRWVLREACRQVQEWGAGLALGAVAPVHVNLSPQEFWDQGLVEHLRRLTEEMSVDASLIRLEVPEIAVARGVPSACRVLTALSEAGFDPWLDRFGEGGIPLGDLSALPVKHVKLARALAWGGLGEEASPLLRSLLAIGHDLGWEASVAGVETAPQQDVLRHAACDLAQGFYYSGLLDPEDAVALARRSAEGYEAPTMH